MNRVLHGELTQPGTGTALNLRSHFLGSYPELPENLSVMGLVAYSVIALHAQRDRIMQSALSEREKAGNLHALYVGAHKVLTP